MTFVINGDFDGAQCARLAVSERRVARAYHPPEAADDGICVNSSRVTVRYILHTGDRLSLALDDRSDDVNENLLPCELPLDIIYENDDFVALNKPAGIATHPSQGHFCDTLANGLAAHYQKLGIPFVFRAIKPARPRDERDCALREKSIRRVAALRRAVRRQNKKDLHCAAERCSRAAVGEYQRDIRRREKSVILREVTSAEAEGAKLALTEYETLASTAEVAFSNAHTGAVCTDGTLTGTMCTDNAHTGAVVQTVHSQAQCVRTMRIQAQ